MKEKEEMMEMEIQARIEEEKSKWEAEMALKLEEARKEGEKIARMSKNQREEIERKKREEDLQRREEEVTRKEIKAEAAAELNKRGLPNEIINAVCLERERYIESIDMIESAFNGAVDKRVNEVLKNKEMPKKGKMKASKADMTYSEYIESLKY